MSFMWSYKEFSVSVNSQKSCSLYISLSSNFLLRQGHLLAIVCSWNKVCSNPLKPAHKRAYKQFQPSY